MDIAEIKNYVGAFALICFLGAALAIAISALQTNTIQNLGLTTVTNESIILLNAVPVNLGNTYVVTVSSVFVNRTGTFETLSPTNYTTGQLGTGNQATITLINGNFTNNQSRVVYNFQNVSKSPGAQIEGYGLLGISNATSYFNTMGILIGIAVLIAIVSGAVWLGTR